MAVVAPGDYGGAVDSNGNPIDGSGGDNPLDLSWLLHPYGGHSTNRGPPVTPQPGPTQTPGTTLSGVGGQLGSPLQQTSPNPALNVPTFPVHTGFGASPAVPMQRPTPSFGGVRPDAPVTQQPPAAPPYTGPTAGPNNGFAMGAGAPLQQTSPNPALNQPRFTLPTVTPAAAAGAPAVGSPAPAVPPIRPTRTDARAPYIAPQAQQRTGYMVPAPQPAVPGPLAALQPSAQQANSPFTMVMRPNAPANDQGGRGGGGPALTTALDLSGYRPPPPAPPSYDLGYGGGAPRAPRAPVARGGRAPAQIPTTQLVPHIGGLGGLTSFGDSPSPGGPAPLGPEALKHIQAGKNWWNGLWR